MPALKFSDETEYDERKSDYDDILKIGLNIQQSKEKSIM